MCDKPVDTCPFIFDSVPDQCMTQAMCYKDAFKTTFLLKYCLDSYIT